MTVDTSPITLYPRKISMLFWLIVCFVIALVGLWIVVTDGAMIGWLTLSLFGLGCIVLVLNMLPGASYLRLSEKGFEVRSLFSSTFTGWGEIDQFVNQDNKAVVFKYHQDHHKAIPGQNIARGIFGIDGALPDTFGMSAEKLASLLNEWKDRFMLPQIT